MNFEEWISNSEFPIEKFKKRIFRKVNLKSELWKVSFENWISKSKFWKESFKKWIPKNKFTKVKKWEKPFPNWKPNTTISYIELDIIVSKLVLAYKVWIFSLYYGIYSACTWNWRRIVCRCIFPSCIQDYIKRNISN